MRIKEAIKESGSSVGDLAQKMGVSRQAISRQINGANITVGTVQRIAEKCLVFQYGSYLFLLMILLRQMRTISDVHIVEKRFE